MGGVQDLHPDPGRLTGMRVPPAPVHDLEIIGHRGDPVRFPENTLPAIRGAILAGADAVEWDIHICGSGEPVLIHDGTVDRTTDGTGEVADLPLPCLRELDAGGWFGEGHAGTRIPTLAEALDLVEATEVGIHCEIKAIRTSADAATILTEFRSRNLLSRSSLISFHDEILEALLLNESGGGERARPRQTARPLRIGRIVGRDERLEGALARVRGRPGSILSPDRRILLADPERTRGWVEEGLDLSPWTVDDPAEAEALVGMGVPRLTTNRVMEMLEWRANRAPASEGRP
jgi:glycerophosphoryl diester phosphodiesterase